MAAPSPGSRRAPVGPARAPSALPQWKGGGVALGPKPRSYAQRTPKKMIRLALRSALSDRAAEGKVIVLDELGLRGPQHQERRRRCSAPWASRAASWWWWVPTTRWPSRASATCPRCTCSSRASSTPTTSWSPTTWCSPATTCPARPTTPRRPRRSRRPRPSRRRRPSRRAKAKPAAKAPSRRPRSTVVDAPAVTEPDAETVSSDPGGDTDMASDLPSRPKPTGEASKPVDPVRAGQAGRRQDRSPASRRPASRPRRKPRSGPASRRRPAASRRPTTDRRRRRRPTTADEPKSSGGF